jgi:hypothetical protein
LQPDFIAYSENFLELKLPLEDVDIQYENNKIIRALFSEQGSGLGKESFSDESIGQIFTISS